jgi:hypothetical protein
MDLTDEQLQLLEAIVDVYDSGCRHEFILIHRLSSGSALVYPGREPVSTTAGDTDFRRLGKEELLDLSVQGGKLRGKPTALGLRFIKELRTRPADVDQESEVNEATSASAGNPAPSMKYSPSKFAQAKREARAMFESRAHEALSGCGDAASFRRRLDDAEVNARSSYLANKNPAWDSVGPAKDMETGREWLEPGEAELLADKQEYEKNLNYLDVWFPTRKCFWLERYAREWRSTKANAPAAETAVEPDPASGDDSGLDFRSEAGRTKAIGAYVGHWTTDSWICTEASLGRTARVHPADLSKWKRGLLPAGSDKKRRIEEALKNNEPPTPPAGRETEA